MKADVYWVFIRHNHPVYGGGVICIDPPKGRPWATAIKCRLRKKDGVFTVMEHFARPFTRGSVVQPEDIAFFLSEKDGDLYQKNPDYFYRIFAPGIERTGT